MFLVDCDRVLKLIIQKDQETKDSGVVSGLKCHLKRSPSAASVDVTMKFPSWLLARPIKVAG